MTATVAKREEDEEGLSTIKYDPGSNAYDDGCIASVHPDSSWNEQVHTYTSQRDLLDCQIFLAESY